MASVLSLEEGSKNDKQLQKAAEILSRGGIIALPTDTLYGVAGLAQNKEATEKLFEIKRRDISKPVAISLADPQDLPRWCHVTVQDTLLGELLPGPVTLIFERNEILNTDLNPGTTTVGVRIPDNDFIRQISRKFQEPLALTSANFSTEPNTIDIQEFHELWSSLDLILDGGMIGNPSREGSTVIDLSCKGKFLIVRKGRAFEETKEKLLKYGLTEL